IRAVMPSAAAAEEASTSTCVCVLRMASTGSGDPECAIVVVDRVPDSATSGELVLPLFEGRTGYFDHPERSLEGMLALIYVPRVAGQGNHARPSCLVPQREAAATPDTPAGLRRVPAMDAVSGSARRAHSRGLRQRPVDEWALAVERTL